MKLKIRLTALINLNKLYDFTNFYINKKSYFNYTKNFSITNVKK